MTDLKIENNEEIGHYGQTLINLPGELSRMKTEGDTEIGKILADFW